MISGDSTEIECPECGEDFLCIDFGLPSSMWDPEEPPCLYCATCGYQRNPTQDEMKDFWSRD